MLRFAILGVLSLCLVASIQARTPLPYNFEAGELITHVSLENEHSIRINVANLQRERTIIELNDLANQTNFYRKSLKEQNGETILLNLMNLENGRYRVDIKQAGVKKTAVVLKRGDKIYVSKVSTP